MSGESPGGWLTLEQLQALAAIGRAGSVAEAARRSGIPRTTLTRRIDELEAHVGVPVLQRTATGVTLTSVGQHLADRGQALLDEVHDLGAAIREESAGSGTLRVAYPCGVHPGVLTATTAALFGALPHVSFRALPGLEVPGDADVALAFGERPPPGPFVARTIARLPVRLLAGRRWVERHGLPTTVAEVTDHPLLCWSTGAEPLALPLVGGGELPVRPRLVTADLHFLHHAARDGLGLVYAIDGGLDEAPGVERLTPVLPDRVGTTTRLWLLVPEAGRPAPRIQEAVRYLLRLADLSSTAT